MPFYGEVRGAGYPNRGGGGFNFETKPKEYTVDIDKEDAQLDIDAEVRTPDDGLNMSGIIFSDKSVRLIVRSNARTSIRYDGRLVLIEE